VCQAKSWTSIKTQVVVLLKLLSDEQIVMSPYSEESKCIVPTCNSDLIILQCSDRSRESTIRFRLLSTVWCLWSITDRTRNSLLLCQTPRCTRKGRQTGTFIVQSNLSIVVTWGRLTKWPLYTGDLYMKGFDFLAQYCTLVVNKHFSLHLVFLIMFTCYFVPVVILLLFTFIVDEIISIWYDLNKTYK
jgi:hypothetical protein